ncbi:MAG: FtsQ-type POTRA domain-containing protein [Actinobacteria bacterium]|nr:FtsQ-type POTRA domain-containing protein [Actinomycetota bacterium]
MSESRRPVDERIRSRRRAVARQNARLRRRVTLSVLAVLALAAAAVAVARSPLFDVTAVRVLGVSGAKARKVRAAADLTTGQSLLSVDLETVAGRIERLGWVAEVSLERLPPATLRINVRERRPAVVLLARGAPWLVDEQGVVLARGRDPGLAIVEAPQASPEPPLGRGVGDPAVANALAVRRRLPAALAADVRRYHAPDVPGLRLLHDSGVWVRFGSAERVALKARVLDAMLAQIRSHARSNGIDPRDGLTAVAEVDVRAPDNPVIVPR